MIRMKAAVIQHAVPEEINFNRMDLNHLPQDALRSMFGFPDIASTAAPLPPPSPPEEQVEAWDKGLEIDFEIDLNHLVRDALLDLLLRPNKTKPAVLVPPEEEEAWDEGLEMEFNIDLDHLLRDALLDLFRRTPPAIEKEARPAHRDDTCTPRVKASRTKEDLEFNRALETYIQETLKELVRTHVHHPYHHDESPTKPADDDEEQLLAMDFNLVDLEHLVHDALGEVLRLVGKHNKHHKWQRMLEEKSTKHSSLLSFSTSSLPSDAKAA